MDETEIRLREFFRYNPATGHFFLRKVRSPKESPSKVGQRVDINITGGYRGVFLAGVSYRAHRVAWLLTFGDWPKTHIDHINGDVSDNRMENLRDVSRSVNLQNQRKAKANSSHGFLGVTPYLKRYKASISIAGTRIHLGVFDTPEEAAAIYLAMKRKFHEGNTL